MSMLNVPTNASDVGETVASVRDYESAQKAVSKLIAAEVPARDIAIVGQGVRTVERVTGRLGYAAAARSGAVNGVLIGLLLSAVLVMGNPDAPIQLFVGFVFIGVALGMVMSLIAYAIVRRRRDFASVTQLAADHYEVTVRGSSLAKARQVLGTQKTAPVRPPVNLDEPPRYGERIAPGTGPSAAPAAVPPRPALPNDPASPPRYGERVVPEAGSGPSTSAAAPANGAPPAPPVAPPPPRAAAAAPITEPEPAEGAAPVTGQGAEPDAGQGAEPDAGQGSEPDVARGTE